MVTTEEVFDDVLSNCDVLLSSLRQTKGCKQSRCSLFRKSFQLL